MPISPADFVFPLTKSGPGKMPKGAGLLIPVTPERWPYTYILTVLNNVSVPSIVTLVDTNPNPTTPITIGPTSSNTVVLKYPNISVTKTADKVNAAVGNVITYTVAFVLPKGTTAYNGQFSDTLHVGQNYNNHATLNGVPVLPQSVIGQVITFPAVPFASAGATDLIFTYSFQALVTANVDPLTLTEVQTNEAIGHWDLTPGIAAPAVNCMFDVTVTNSSVPTLASGASATAIFSVQVLAENLPEIPNGVTGTFRITPTDPTNYEAVPSSITIIEVGKAVLANLVVSECIIVDIVYSQCQQRVCLERISIDPPTGYGLINVEFHPDVFVPGSLELTPLVDRPNFSRVRFFVSVPYTATFRNTCGNTITQDLTLPDFTVDTTLYLPTTRSEVSFNILINTHSTLLSIDSVNATISVGVILIISAVAQVPLLIPSAGFCSDVCNCEEYIPPQDTPCVDFLDETKTAFPIDFYPPQESDC